MKQKISGSSQNSRNYKSIVQMEPEILREEDAMIYMKYKIVDIHCIPLPNIKNMRIDRIDIQSRNW
jgi:hypothetical protein